MLKFFTDIFTNPIFLTVLKTLWKTAFIWFPILCLLIIWELWVRYVQALFFSKQKYVLLEIKVPREVFKSPQAAEFFINSLHQNGGEGNWYEKYWKGQVRSWFSLEITSINGSVHFYVWTKVGHRSVLEANLYSQYPGIEIFETDDYTLPISYNPDINTIWATEFDLTKPDVFPIKTYIDYGLEKDPKEEYKIDPITPLIEFLGGIPRDQQVWIQILVRSHKDEDIDPTTGKSVDLRWAKAAQKEIDTIINSAKGEKDKDGKIVPGTGRQLTDVERETINALGRSVSKKGFDVGMRAIYIAPKDSFNPSNIGGIIGGITHFNSSLNGFKPARGVADNYSFFLLAWKPRSAKAKHEEKADLLDKYKKRAYFHSPLKSPHFVLNSEELATLFHFPGGVSVTPSFGRIESKKAEAPSNLPV
jgi:hypothetical protein